MDPLCAPLLSVVLEIDAAKPSVPYAHESFKQAKYHRCNYATMFPVACFAERQLPAFGGTSTCCAPCIPRGPCSVLTQCYNWRAVSSLSILLGLCDVPCKLESNSRGEDAQQACCFRTVLYLKTHENILLDLATLRAVEESSSLATTWTALCQKDRAQLILH
eukprot:1145625-Pelagomonas_calceolata.AAC.14